MDKGRTKSNRNSASNRLGRDLRRGSSRNKFLKHGKGKGSSSMEMKRLATSNGFWSSPDAMRSSRSTSSASPGELIGSHNGGKNRPSLWKEKSTSRSPNHERKTPKSSKDTSRSSSRSRPCSKELKRLRTTEGFWSSPVSNDEVTDPSVDTEKDNTIASIDRVTRKSMGSLITRTDEDCTLNSGIITSKRTRSAISPSMDDKGLQSAESKSTTDGKKSFYPKQKSSQPVTKRPKLADNKHSRGNKFVKESKSKLEHFKSKAKRKVKTEICGPQNKDVPTFGDSNTQDFPVSGSNLTASPHLSTHPVHKELKRLDTTDGFWSPLPEASAVFDEQTSRHRKVKKEPVSPHSRLLEHRKRKLKSLKRLAQIRSRTTQKATADRDTDLPVKDNPSTITPETINKKNVKNITNQSVDDATDGQNIKPSNHVPQVIKIKAKRGRPRKKVHTEISKNQKVSPKSSIIKSSKEPVNDHQIQLRKSGRLSLKNVKIDIESPFGENLKIENRESRSSNISKETELLSKSTSISIDTPSIETEDKGIGVNFDDVDFKPYVKKSNTNSISTPPIPKSVQIIYVSPKPRRNITDDDSSHNKYVMVETKSNTTIISKKPTTECAGKEDKKPADKLSSEPSSSSTSKKANIVNVNSDENKAVSLLEVDTTEGEVSISKDCLEQNNEILPQTVSVDKDMNNSHKIIDVCPPGKGENRTQCDTDDNEKYSLPKSMDNNSSMNMDEVGKENGVFCQLREEEDEQKNFVVNKVQEMALEQLTEINSENKSLIDECNEKDNSTQGVDKVSIESCPDINRRLAHAAASELTAHCQDLTISTDNQFSVDKANTSSKGTDLAISDKASECVDDQKTLQSDRITKSDQLVPNPQVIAEVSDKQSELVGDDIDLIGSELKEKGICQIDAVVKMSDETVAKENDSDMDKPKDEEVLNPEESNEAVEDPSEISHSSSSHHSGENVNVTPLMIQDSISNPKCGVELSDSSELTGSTVETEPFDISPNRNKASPVKSKSLFKSSLRRAKKRKSNRWKNGVINKRRFNPCGRISSKTMAGGEQADVSLKKKLESRLKPESNSVDVLAKEASKILDISPNREKPKKLVNALKKLRTDANLANALLDDKTLQTRARRGLLPVVRPGPSKRHKLLLSGNGNDTVKPQTSLFKRTHHIVSDIVEVQESANGVVEKSLPVLYPLEFAPSRSEDQADVTPPVLTPQQPASSLEKTVDSFNAEDEVVNESVDDTDFHLYLSGASDEEESHQDLFIPNPNILSGSSKLNQGKSTSIPILQNADDINVSDNLYSAADNDPNTSNSMSSSLTATTDENPIHADDIDETPIHFSKVKNRTNVIVENKTLLTAVPKKGRGKMKGKRGKPPGIRASQGDLNLIKPKRTVCKSVTSLDISPIPMRTFEFRKKSTRSPLEMLEMKRKQEEAIYDLEMERLETRKIIRREKRNSLLAMEPVIDTDLEDYYEYDVKPCSVVLTDFVKKLNLNVSLSDLYTNVPDSPCRSDEYVDDLGDEDWCADLEDVDDDDESSALEKRENFKRPYIPRLKLKRVPKKDKSSVLSSKGRNLVSEMKSPEMEPLKLVIKTDGHSDSDSSGKTGQVVPQGSSIFETNYVQFLKQRSSPVIQTSPKHGNHQSSPRSKPKIYKSSCSQASKSDQRSSNLSLPESPYFSGNSPVGHQNIITLPVLAKSLQSINNNMVEDGTIILDCSGNDTAIEKNVSCGTSYPKDNGKDSLVSHGNSGPIYVNPLTNATSVSGSAGIEANALPTSVIDMQSQGINRSMFVSASSDSTTKKYNSNNNNNNNNNDVNKLNAVTELTDSSSPVHSTSQDLKNTIGSEKLKTIIPSHIQKSGSYKCKRCGFMADSKILIESHIYNHIPGVIFKCAFCPAKFNSMVFAANHLKNMHKNNEIQFYVSQPVDESNFYTFSTVEEEEPMPSASSLSETVSSLAVSGRARRAKARFVCTHCGFFTNIKEDVEHHVSDLHSSSILFMCTLCKDYVGVSAVEIKDHCSSVHPTRQRPYAKLPDYYDADQLAMIGKSVNSDDRKSDMLWISSLLAGEASSRDDSPADHQLNAKDYMYLQERLKEKTSAEADSTTATDFASEMQCSEEVDAEAELQNGSSKEESCVQESENEGDASQLKIAQVVSLSALSSLDGFNEDADRGATFGNQQDQPNDYLTSPCLVPQIESISSSAISSISRAAESRVDNTRINDNQNIDASTLDLQTCLPKSIASQSSVVSKESNSGLTTSHSFSSSESSFSSLSKSAAAHPNSTSHVTPTSSLVSESSSCSSGGLPLSYQCKSCKVHTPYLLMMVRHLKSRHPKILCFSCPYCKLTHSFNTQKQLRQHIRASHPENVDKNEMSLSEEAKKFVEAMVLPKSPQCTKVGNRLILEEDIHTCTVCSLRMTSLSNVYDHLNEKHSDLFDFVCPSCQSFKNKSLQAVSDHCTAVHHSDLDKDKVHVSVPKYLFSILTCISKQSKYIEKLPNSDGNSSKEDSTNNDKSKPSQSKDIKSSSDATKGNVTSGTSLNEARQTSFDAGADKDSMPPSSSSSGCRPSSADFMPPPAHHSPSQAMSRMDGFSHGMVRDQTPSLVIPSRQPINVSHPSVRPGVAISSSLFDTSSLCAPQSAGPATDKSDSLKTHSITHQMPLNLPKQKSVSASGDANRSYALPVLNVPTIRQRTFPLPSAFLPSVVKQHSNNNNPRASPSHPKDKTLQSSSLDQLPDDEPNPDAFKIFNLRPTGMTPPTMPSPAPSPAAMVIPTVFPPVSSSVSLPSGFIPGPMAGFPAAMVIPPGLIHSAFPFAAHAAAAAANATSNPMAMPVEGQGQFSQRRNYQPGKDPSNPSSAGSQASFPHQGQKQHQPQQQQKQHQQWMQQKQQQQILQQQQQQQLKRIQQQFIRTTTMSSASKKTKPTPRHQSSSTAVVGHSGQTSRFSPQGLPPPPSQQQFAHQQLSTAYRIEEQPLSNPNQANNLQLSTSFLATSSGPSTVASSGPNRQIPFSSYSPSSSLSSKKGVKSSPLYKCPYCSICEPLKALEVASHIRQAHPGQQVTFQKAT